MKYIVCWEEEAWAFFQHAVNYIALRSPKNAEKVETDLLSKID